jgi:hypothetical protein
MTQISVTAETTDRLSLEEARSFIDRLLAQTPERSEPEVALAEAESGAPRRELPDEMELAQRFVDDLFGRTGAGLHQLVSAMASFDDQFSLAHIAEETGESLPKTHSRFASLGRSIKVARKNVPDAPELFTAHERPGDLWHFSMPESIRTAVRQAEARAE